MNTIHTYDKPTLISAFTLAIAADSDTLIKHERKCGTTELYIKGEAQALRTPDSFSDKAVIRFQKKVLRNRRRAVSKMKRAAVKVLCS